MTIALPGEARVIITDESIVNAPERAPLRHFTITGDVRTNELANHRIRSEYVEEHWLPFIGPTAMLFARRCDLTLTHDNKAAVPISKWAESFGVTYEDLLSAVRRLIRYGLATWVERDSTLLLRRHWPSVPEAITTPEHKAVLTGLPDIPDFR